MATLGNISSRPVIAVAIAMIYVMSCLNACSFKQDTMAQFKALPSEGWSKDMPIRFTPEYADSTLTYDLQLTIRHNNSYQFSNLSLAVDMVDSVKVIHRKDVDFVLSDSYGNWQGSGFGALYQTSIIIATGIKPSDVNSIVVWQTMAGCDVVKDVIDIGITVAPSKN